MSAKKSTRRTTSARRRPNVGRATLRSILLSREAWGLVLTAIGAITIIALTSSDQGVLSRNWALALRQMFGLGAYPVSLLMLAGGIALLLWQSIEERFVPRWQGIVGWEILFFASLGVVHVLGSGSAAERARVGRHGGYVGYALWKLLVPSFGEAIALIILGFLLLVGWYLVINIPPSVPITWLGWAMGNLGARMHQRVAASRAAAVAHQSQVNEAPAPLSVPQKERASPTAPSLALQRATMDSATPTTGSRQRSSRSARTRAHTTRTKAGDLPPTDILASDEVGETDEADARHNAQIIEETLDAFGVPAKVVEWNRGPVVTQFGVEPGYLERTDRDGNTRRQKIRVSKILSLTNDLALALAATPIRIEAPVPGRSVVGIEVPNAAKALVGLRGVLEAPQFVKSRSPLRVGLGRDVSGDAIVADLTAMPHLLLAGATGSGKSVCLNATICSLLFQRSPNELRLLMVDPKRVELTKYDGIPHLIAPVVVDVEKVIIALRWLAREMDKRYKSLASVKARDIMSYNRKAKSAGEPPLPYIVLVIDELADLMLAAPDDVERTICRLAQMARAVGIHLVIATQRPSVDVVTGLIKANFPARISFAVTSQVDSRVILDTPGAENLLGRGDMLYMAPDSPKLQRIQGCFVSDQEIERLVDFWLDKRNVPEEQDDEAPWEGMSLEDDSDDSLLQEATDLVCEHEHASASFLQRHLRIGYPRAARLIDQLEERGVVGPQESGGRSREVLLATDGEDDLADAEISIDS